ncbi:hypothetical protein D3C78_946530 [compost metagenome]
MYTYRIEVFHITYNDAVIVRIAHNLILNFLHTGNGFLDQALADRAVTNSRCDRLAQLFLVRANAAARSAQRIGWTNNDRVTDLVSKIHSILYRCYNIAIRHRLLQLAHQITEQVAVLRFLNSG